MQDNLDELLDKDGLIKLLKEMQGGQSITSFASSLKCSTAYLSSVYNGTRTIGPKLLEAVGIEKQVVYRKRWR